MRNEEHGTTSTTFLVDSNPCHFKTWAVSGEDIHLIILASLGLTWWKSASVGSRHTQMGGDLGRIFGPKFND